MLPFLHPGEIRPSFLLQSSIFRAGAAPPLGSPLLFPPFILPRSLYIGIQAPSYRVFFDTATITEVKLWTYPCRGDPATRFRHGEFLRG